ncbi:hypothetical protein SeLEV6574_g04104 [Synchytrium endobioticum]|uniref:SANT domain-containing protein n=1 Tax=Synchytrium endobioticum TaxID=286115 RepID=A0A507D1H1_9FUNG|nr:hypothetical protein SeLEV6574_g04104 [Synchytrium endobioticum]
MSEDPRYSKHHGDGHSPRRNYNGRRASSTFLPRLSVGHSPHNTYSQGNIQHSGFHDTEDLTPERSRNPSSASGGNIYNYSPGRSEWPQQHLNTEYHTSTTPERRRASRWDGGNLANQSNANKRYDPPHAYRNELNHSPKPADASDYPRFSSSTSTNSNSNLDYQHRRPSSPLPPPRARVSGPHSGGIAYGGPPRMGDGTTNSSNGFTDVNRRYPSRGYIEPHVSALELRQTGDGSHATIPDPRPSLLSQMMGQKRKRGACPDDSNSRACAPPTRDIPSQQWLDMSFTKKNRISDPEPRSPSTFKIPSTRPSMLQDAMNRDKQQQKQHRADEKVEEEEVVTDEEEDEDLDEEADKDEEDTLDNEDIEQKIDQLDAEIAKYEAMLAQIRQKKEAASKSIETEGGEAGSADQVSVQDPPDILKLAEIENEPLVVPPGLPLHEQIYMANRHTRRITARVMAVQLRTLEANSLPPPSQIYRLDDFDFLEANIESHQRLRTLLVCHIRNRRLEMLEKRDNLRATYEEMYQVWKKHLERLERERERRRKKAGNAEKGPMLPPEVIGKAATMSSAAAESMMYGGGSGGTLTRRSRAAAAAFTSDAVRSEAEWMAAIAHIMNQDGNVDTSRLAPVPDMMLDSGERHSAVHLDFSQLVRDPVDDNKKMLETASMCWSDEDKYVFEVKLVQIGKNFRKIAEFLPGKTTQDCVRYYYREKERLGLKTLLRRTAPGAGRSGLRRARGGALARKLMQQFGNSVSMSGGDGVLNEQVDLEEYDEEVAMDIDRLRRGGGARSKSKGGKSGTSSHISSHLQQRQQTNHESDNDDHEHGGPNIQQNASASASTTLKWSDDDRTKFQEALQQYGRDWASVASHTGKSEADCRLYWRQNRFKGLDEILRAFDAARRGPAALRKRRTTAGSNADGDVNTNDDDGRGSVNEDQGGNEDSRGEEAEEVDDADMPKRKPRSRKLTNSLLTPEAEPEDVNRFMQQQQPQNQQQSQALKSRGGRARKNTTRRSKAHIEEATEAPIVYTSDLYDADGSAGGESRKPVSSWSPGEKEAFMSAVQQVGCDWDTIAEILSSKSSAQIRSYYQGHSKELIKVLGFDPSRIKVDSAVNVQVDSPSSSNEMDANGDHRRSVSQSSVGSGPRRDDVSYKTASDFLAVRQPIHPSQPSPHSHSGPIYAYQPMYAGTPSPMHGQQLSPMVHASLPPGAADRIVSQHAQFPAGATSFQLPPVYIPYDRAAAAAANVQHMVHGIQFIAAPHPPTPGAQMYQYPRDFYFGPPNEVQGTGRHSSPHGGREGSATSMALGPPSPTPPSILIRHDEGTALPSIRALISAAERAESGSQHLPPIHHAVPPMIHTSVPSFENRPRSHSPFPPQAAPLQVAPIVIHAHPDSLRDRSPTPGGMSTVLAVSPMSSHAGDTGQRESPQSSTAQHGQPVYRENTQPPLAPVQQSQLHQMVREHSHSPLSMYSPHRESSIGREGTPRELIPMTSRELTPSAQGQTRELTAVMQQHQRDVTASAQQAERESSIGQGREGSPPPDVSVASRDTSAPPPGSN